MVPTDSDWIVLSVGLNDAAPWKRIAIEEFEANCDRILAGMGGAARLVLGPGPVRERGVRVLGELRDERSDERR